MKIGINHLCHSIALFKIPFAFFEACKLEYKINKIKKRYKFLRNTDELEKHKEIYGKALKLNTKNIKIKFGQSPLGNCYVERTAYEKYTIKINSKQPDNSQLSILHELLHIYNRDMDRHTIKEDKKIKNIIYNPKIRNIFFLIKQYQLNILRDNVCNKQILEYQIHNKAFNKIDLSEKEEKLKDDIKTSLEKVYKLNII